MPTGTDSRVWYRCSLEDWLKLTRLRDDWLKNLQGMNSREFAIHRKLGEAAGLHCRYIIPARGSGKSLFYTESLEDAKKIFKKYRAEAEPQEFVTIKDGDIEKWLYEEMRKEHIERVLDIFRENSDEGPQRKVITSHNPYWDFDPCWTIDKDGNHTLKEVSYIPNYLWDKEIL